jgi:hypothetical protein
MARATAHPDHQCISSEDIHGTEVYGPDGKHIGEIDHLIIDKVSGRVAGMRSSCDKATAGFGGVYCECRLPRSRHARYRH